MTDDPDEVKFTDMQEKLYGLLRRAMPHDVKISEMYFTLYGVPTEVTGIRSMQQKLAPVISRVNAKLYLEEIRPGELKRTYRLYPTKAPKA